MNRKNAAVIGYGAIGPIHAAAIAKSDFSRLYAVCDTDPNAQKRAESEHAEHGTRIFSSYDELLRDKSVDSVHICTPHFLHAEMLVKAHDAGKHIVVEKPAVMLAAEAESVRRVFSDGRVRCCAVLQNRLNPCVREMKRIIDGGEYGEVIGAKGAVTWLRDKAYYESGEWRGRRATEGGGAVINQALHTLDLLRYLCGDFVSVKSHCSNRGLKDVIEVEDTAEAFMLTESGARVLFYATNSYAVSAPVEVEVQLERAVLKYTYSRLFLICDGELRELAADKKADGEKWYWGKCHETLINNFYSSLCGAEREYPSLEEGLKTAETVFEIYKENE